MKTSNMINKLAKKMEATNKSHKNDKVELCESESVFTSEIHSVCGLNNRYISQAEYEQLVALQAYLREQREVNVENLTKYILGSGKKDLKFIKAVLEVIPDLISRLISKNQESDIKGFAIEYIQRTKNHSKKEQDESESLEEDLEDKDSYNDEQCE